MTNAKHDKKSPHIVGLRPPMCRTNFLAGKHNANPLNILVHLQLSCAQRGKALGYTVVGRSKFAANNRKLTHDVITTSWSLNLKLTDLHLTTTRLTFSEPWTWSSGYFAALHFQRLKVKCITAKLLLHMSEGIFNECRVKRSSAGRLFQAPATRKAPSQDLRLAQSTAKCQV